MKSMLKHAKSILAIALVLAIGVAFMPLTGDGVHGASFSTSKAVSGLTVSSTGAQSIAMKWNAYGGAKGYEVYKANSLNGTYSKIKTTSSTSYSRTGLTTNLTCYYKVRAYFIKKNGSYIYSNFSNVVAGTPAGFATNGAVSGLKVASYTSTSIKLIWSAYRYANGYEVYKATSKNGTYKKFKTTSATSFGRTGLTTNKTCYYKVRAYCRNANGTYSFSKFSPIIAATPIGFSASGTVSNLKLASAGYNSILLKWSAYPQAGGYEVYKATSQSGTYKKFKTTTATSFSRTGLTTNKTCYYKVRAYKKNSNGTYSYSKFSSVVAGTPRLAVPAMKVTTQSGSALVTWTGVSGASGYQVYRATSKNGSYSCVKTLTGTSFTNSSITKNTAYYYKVRAYRTVSGSKAYGSFCGAQAGMAASVAQVKGVTAASTSTSVKLGWTKQADVTGYQIYRSSGNTNKYTLVGTATGNTFNDVNVANGLTYYYKIRAYKKVGSLIGYGAFSATGYSRSVVVSTAVGWLGCKESNASNKPIIDLYNANMGTRFSYRDAWCAMFVSAVAIKSGTTPIIVRGSYCPTVRSTYVNSKTSNYKYGAGSKYVPKAGDVIFFDWNKNGVPDHTGLVASVSGNTVKTIEGNYSDAVGYRTFSVGYSYVQGYGLPNYNEANGIVYTGRTNSSVGCGELSATGIGMEPEGYEALGEEYDFVEQKVEDNVGCGEDVSEYDKMVYMVKKVRANAETEGIDCSETQYYAAFIYKLCQEAGIDASIMTAEDEYGNVNAWVEASLDGTWYKVLAAQQTGQIIEFTPEVTDIEEY